MKYLAILVCLTGCTSTTIEQWELNKAASICGEITSIQKVHVSTLILNARVRCTDGKISNIEESK